jgi:hypothetical protein
MSIESGGRDFALPTVLVHFPGELAADAPSAISRALLAGSPRIFVPSQREPAWHAIHPLNLSEDDLALVAQRVRSAIGAYVGGT